AGSSPRATFGEADAIAAFEPVIQSSDKVRESALRPLGSQNGDTCTRQRRSSTISTKPCRPARSARMKPRDCVRRGRTTAHLASCAADKLHLVGYLPTKVNGEEVMTAEHRQSAPLQESDCTISRG